MLLGRLVLATRAILLDTIYCEFLPKPIASLWFVNRCLRRIMNVKWSDKVSNNTLWTKTDQLPVEIEIKRRKWRWIGHTLRKPTTSITRQALTWNPQGKRKRGRPRNTWRRDVESEARKMGYTWQEIATMAQRRIRWRALIDGPCSQRVDGHK